MTYNPPDFYDLDDQFSSEELQVRDSIRNFVSQKIIPVVEDHYLSGTFPKELVSQIAELKLLGPTIEGYGCAGVNSTTYGLMMQEVERGDSGLRSFVSVQSALSMYPIWKFGTGEQKEKYLPKMAKGELIGCFGLTEPNHGSNPAGMETTIRETDGGYLLNGHKKWLTNGSFADLAIIWAKNAEGKLNGLIVNRDLDGIEVRKITNKHSLRVSDSTEYIFTNVKVPKENLLQVQGFKGPFSCLNQARLGISWGAIGAAQACYEETLKYVQNREQFGKPLASFQLIQAKLANMVTEITKMQLLSLRLSRLVESGKMKPEQISMAKMNNVSQALNIARTCRDILGANGILSDFQTMRHMCNLETVNTYEGTEDIHRLIVGNSVTGVPAFS